MVFGKAFGLFLDRLFIRLVVFLGCFWDALARILRTWPCLARPSLRVGGIGRKASSIIRGRGTNNSVGMQSP